MDSYLQLRLHEQKLFDSELERMPEREKESVMEITTSWKEEGLAQGREEGRQKGRQEGIARAVLLLLESLYGSVPDELETRVAALPVEALERLTRNIRNLSTLDDVKRWLDERI